MHPDEPLFPVGSFVFAKLQGYRPWPAKVKSAEKCENSFKYEVKFYGSYDRAHCLEKCLYPYNMWVKERNSRNRDHAPQALYERALKELEEDLEVLERLRAQQLQKRSRLQHELEILSDND